MIKITRGRVDIQDRADRKLGEVQVNGSKLAISNRLLDVISEPVKCTIATYDGSGQAAHCSVVHIRGGFGPQKYEWWMANTPYPESDTNYEKPCINASHDGVNWIEPCQNPIATEPAGVAYLPDPKLIWDKVNRKLRVYYSGRELGIYFVESSDGITWSDPTILVNCVGGQMGIVLDEYGYRLMAVNTFPNTNDSMFYQESVDGITWTDRIEVVHGIELPYYHDATEKDGLGYHSTGGAYRQNYFDGMERYYGYSRDGYRFVYDSQPFLIPKVGTWYGSRIYQSSIVSLENDTHRIYFSAANGETWGIGFIDVKLNNPGAKWDSWVKTRKWEIWKTLVKDQVVPFAGEGFGGWLNVPRLGQDMTVVAIIINQHPWSLYVNEFTPANDWKTTNAYPEISNYAETASLTNPKRCILLPTLGCASPSTLTDALEIVKMGSISNARIRLRNLTGAVDATATIKVGMFFN